MAMWYFSCTVQFLEEYWQGFFSLKPWAIHKSVTGKLIDGISRYHLYENCRLQLLSAPSTSEIRTHTYHFSFRKISVVYSSQQPKSRNRPSHVSCKGMGNKRNEITQTIIFRLSVYVEMLDISPCDSKQHPCAVIISPSAIDIAREAQHISTYRVLIARVPHIV